MAVPSFNTVFIDTSLGTHLAMTFSYTDTVSDVKDKIEKEHPLCFPHLGNIKIHSIKVMRRGFFYHLSDSMYLKSAFVGYDECWFLSIDASIVDGHSIDPNTGDLSTYFERADGTSVDRINLARNNHCGQIPNCDVPRLKGSVTQQYVNEKAPTDIFIRSCHYSKKDLTIKKAEVTCSVEKCSKDQSDRTGNGCEGLNETPESLPTVKANQRSKKKKIKKINDYEVVNHTSDDNDQSALQKVVGSFENFREYAHDEDSDLPVMERKSNVDEPGQISSFNIRDESEHGMKQKFNLYEETEADGKNDRSKHAIHLMDNSSFEVAAQGGSTAKKIHKTEMISGVMNGVEGKRDLVSDSSKATSTPKVTSEYLSNKKQTAKVILGSLSTEPDAHLLETGSSDMKKKSNRKRAYKLPGCPSEAVGLISTGVDQEDASRESDITTVPSPDTEKDLASKSKDATDLQKSISTSEDANNVQSNHLMCKTGKIVAIPEERDSLQNADTKASMVEICHSSSWDGTDANIKATHISELVHLKGTTENTKHGKKKKTKKSRDSAEERQINLVTTGARDSTHDIPPTEPQSITLGDNSCSQADIGESNVGNVDIDKSNLSQVEPLLQINKTQAVAEAMDGKVKKKSKKRPAASMKSTPNLQAGSICNEDSLPSKRSDRKVKSVSIAAKKTEFSEVKSRNEIEGANMHSTLFSEVESRPSICKKSKTVGPSLTLPRISEGSERRSLEANRCSNTTKDGTTDNLVEVPSRSDKVGIQEKADGAQHESIKLHDDKLSREKDAETLQRTKRKKRKPSACSSATSLSMQNIQKSDENVKTGEHCQMSNSSALKLHESSTKDKCDGTLHVDSKLKKISGGGVESSISNKHKQKMSDSIKVTGVREKATDPSRDSTEINSETSSLTGTRLKLKKSANMVHQDRKQMGHQSTVIGHPLSEWKSSQSGRKVVTQSERKSLSVTSRGIFNDASSESSEDEGGIADSDASTRSPDNSLTSDFSDGESNGSVDSERTNIHKRSMRKKDPSSPEDISLDTILRSSSRYKKAKLTAAQLLQQDDTESQPVDFVPDSQANI